ncbi:MAG: glycoside hydrolase family 65 protein [Bacillaceae bacterium]
MTQTWSIQEKKINVNELAKNESIFAIGNGYIGVRGYFEEGYGADNGLSVRGTYINGFFDTSEIVYGEDHYGNPHEMEMMLSIPDGLRTTITVDGEGVTVFGQQVEDYIRELRLKEGYLVRSFTWRAKDGARFTFTFKRLASFIMKEIVALHIEVKSHDRSANVQVASYIDGKTQNVVEENDPRVNNHVKERQLETIQIGEENGVTVLKQQTKTNNGIFTLVSTDELSKEGTIETTIDEQQEVIKRQHTFVVEAAETVAYTKYNCYIINEMADGASLLKAAQELSFAGLVEKQTEYVTAFWKTSDIEIDGDDKVQESIRFSLYQMLQSVGKDETNNIAAKGVTGEGYGGHYFWDTETYIFPFFLYTQPEMAKSLLAYRYHILDGARARAKELGFKGALFPWRTISGKECSAYYPAGTAQIHINADIMYALAQYYNVTGDKSFLNEKGIEMLVETTRFYVDYGDWVEGKGFCINCVTGPDEYTALINNNTYTNMMVKYQISFLLQVIEEARQEGLFAQWQEKFSITDAEMNEWKQVVESMYIHRAENNLIGQDDSFLGKAPWNFEETPKENYPLLLHYHPMVIYKHQVLKQADLLLAMLLLPTYFTKEEKEVNYKFYEPLTTHDSSLSYCIYSIIASEVGLEDEAENYFNETIRLDLDDTHHNTKHGLHMACMGGSWLNVVFGFGGMRVIDGTLTFNPTLPKGWNRISFNIGYKGRQIKVEMTKEATTYTLLSGDAIDVVHNGVKQTIN